MDFFNFVSDLWSKHTLFIVVFAALFIIKLVSKVSKIKPIEGSKVIQIHTQDEWNALVVQSDKVVVVDFYADWCGPCRTCSPYYDYFSQKYDDTKATFCKVNVDELGGIARDCGVTSMPCFLIYKDKKVVGSVLGWSDFNLINSMKTCGLEEIPLVPRSVKKEE